MATYFERPERGWTPIPRELIHATELSPVARLVLMHALSNKADWEEPAWRIAEALGLSRERVINALGELKKTGHARKTAKVTTPGRPPNQGWDFAWPAFIEDTRHSRVLPSSENPTMAEDPQVAPIVGFHHDGKTRRREKPTMAEPTMENPTPLQDCSSNETVLEREENPHQDKKHSDKPPTEPASEEPEHMAMIDFNDYDLPVQTTPPKKKPRAGKPTEDPDFDRAWELYANKTDKHQAFKAWLRARRTTSAEEILAAIPAYVAVTVGKGEPEGRGSAWKPRRKNLATWLNNLGWTEEIEAPKTGYQGQAGSDAKDPQVYLDMQMDKPICKLVRNGPAAGDREMSFAWYYHFHRDEQSGWTVEQMIETGNTPEDIDRLMDAYQNGIDPQLYQQFLTDYGIDPAEKDAR